MSVLQNVQTILNLVQFVPVMEILTTMNVNSRKLLVDNRNRYKLSTKDLAVSMALLFQCHYYISPSLSSFLSLLLSHFLPCFIHLFRLFVPPFQLSFLPFIHFIKLIFIILAECKCPPYAQCQRDENNFKKYKCACPPSSTADKSEVCGSNGRTYINRQVLERESCLFEIKVNVLHSGTCSE